MLDSHSPRAVSRKHVLLKGRLISEAGEQWVMIRNLSASGVQIICDRLPAAGADVIFNRGDVCAAARVAWANDKSAGLEFYEPLDPAALAAGSR